MRAPLGSSKAGKYSRKKEKKRNERSKGREMKRKEVAVIHLNPLI
jgi:hypothetical protein